MMIEPSNTSQKHASHFISSISSLYPLHTDAKYQKYHTLVDRTSTVSTNSMNPTLSSSMPDGPALDAVAE